jgi:signal transduction histidine kinase
VSHSVNSSENALIQQLRQSLGMLQVAFDAATEAMLIIDAERQVHWANQAAADLLLGGVPIQLANRKLDDLMALKPEQVDGHPMLALLDRRYPLPNASGDGRCRIALNDGGRSASLWLRWRPVELIQAQFLLLTFRDLSPDEQALIQQQRFMTDLTHELRTPLAIVNGNLQRLSRFKDLPSAARSRLAMVGEEVDRIRRLIDHLSLLTRLKVDPALLGFGEHDLLPLLKRWYEALDDQAIGLDGLEQLQSTPCMVGLDPNALLLVLDLLLDNALRYGDGSYPIQLQLRRLDQQNCVQIAIKNHGTGVPVSESMLKSWLNPFIRGGLRRDGRQVEGAGLGLALAREIVMAWKGTLALEQSALMDGSLTTALLTLPISQAAGDGGGPVNAQKDLV